ncbi:MAG: type II toxin-antitoxin system PrlF family antitoxin, partial [Rhodocyclales bacterium]|nr:type II toxin-antitoxin system PrlF family antitoxin [Rhodocyclales bacterium]
MLATLTSKGQVTVPSSIREALKLDAGARLDFALQDDGSIRVVPVSRD